MSKDGHFRMQKGGRVLQINMGKPSPKQEQFLKAVAKVVIFGGARGGRQVMGS